jgi:hypothetical protein
MTGPQALVRDPAVGRIAQRTLPFPSRASGIATPCCSDRK